MARALAWHARGHQFDPDILHAAARDCGERSLTRLNKVSKQHKSNIDTFARSADGATSPSRVRERTDTRCGNVPTNIRH